MAAYFFFRIAKYVDALKAEMEAIRQLKHRMDLFEADFSEKFDQFVRNMGSRDKMRATRAEKSEDSNNTSSPEVLIPI